MVVAEAVTIHKSQGQSMTAVTVHLDVGKVDKRALYVALSRATSLQGLYIVGQFKVPNTTVATNTLVEMERLRSEALLVPKFKILQMVHDDEIQIVSFNCQSLRRHLQSIISDTVLMSCHILLFQETWCTDYEVFDVPGYNEIVRNKYSGRPTAFGMYEYFFL